MKGSRGNEDPTFAPSQAVHFGLAQSEVSCFFMVLSAAPWWPWSQGSGTSRR